MISSRLPGQGPLQERFAEGRAPPRPLSFLCLCPCSGSGPPGPPAAGSHMFLVAPQCGSALLTRPVQSPASRPGRGSGLCPQTLQTHKPCACLRGT